MSNKSAYINYKNTALLPLLDDDDDEEKQEENDEDEEDIKMEEEMEKIRT